MTIHTFAAGSSITFNYATDTISIADLGVDAASVRLRMDGGNLLIVVGAQVMTLLGGNLTDFGSGHIVLANGSLFLKTSTNDDSLTGSAGNDYLDGGHGIDIMSGGDGADLYFVNDGGDVVTETNTSTAAAQRDQVVSNLANYTLGANVEDGSLSNASGNLTGNALANTLYAGTGNNVLTGAAGTDTVSYAEGATAGVTVSLAVATAQATGGSGSDTLSGIENLVGSAYGDKLVGTTGANALTGGTGNDSLYGGTGSDTMSGGDGADLYSVQDVGDVVIETNTSNAATEADIVYSYISNYTLGANVEQGRIMNVTANMTGNAQDNLLYASSGANVLTGGDGLDTASYAFGATAAVTLNLGLAGAQATGGSGSDTLVGIENLEGSAFADSLAGDANANALTGGAGNDTLSGAAGNDSLDGGTGVDSMSGEDGADTYSVRDAGDLVVETNSSGAATESDTVLSYLADYTLGDNVEHGRVMLDTIGGLTGNALDNTLYASTGDNVLDGADGIDTVSYELSTERVFIDLLSSEQDTYGSGYDTLINIENVTGSAYDDALVGNDGDNVLMGGAGDDLLWGAVGNDTLGGGDGADLYVVEEAGDVIVETNTSGDAAQLDLVLSYLADYTLTANVEQGRITALGAANLTGSAGANVLYGNDDNNLLDGAGGSDTASYYDASAAVTVSLALAGAQATGSAGMDTLVNIENLEGSHYADKLTGNSGANALSGGEGNDSLYGGTGIDTMTGGEGADTYSVQDTGDVVVETNSATTSDQADLLYSYVTNYTLSANIEQGRVMNAVQANMTGNEMDNLLYTSAGANALNGAGGSDTVSYAFGAGSGVTVSLAVAGAQATGGSGSDTLTSIENLVGSAHADTLTGSDAANALSGAAGNDTLHGGAGNDTLDGGSGVDTMNGGDGADTYYVSDIGDAALETNATASAAETDMVVSTLADFTLGTHVENGQIASTGAANMTGNASDNLIYAGTGANVISGLAGTDTVSYALGAASGVSVSLALASAQATGGSGSDTLSGIENLVGTAYVDKLVGSSGANALDGAAGNDSVFGGTGSDTMRGGDGADTYSVQDTGDVIIETNTATASSESDFVFSYITNYTLGANVEQGRVMNIVSANLTGNGLDNMMFTSVGNNIFNGGAGNDTVSYAFGASSGVTVLMGMTTAQLTGGSGSDTLLSIENVIGSAHGDTIYGDDSANAITGGAGNDQLNGADGADTLDGGTGTNTMSGGAGADTYIVSDASDVLIESLESTDPAESDLVLSYVADFTLTDHIEQARVMLEAGNLTGNAQDNVLHASSGDNAFDGGDGVDTVSYADSSQGITVDLTALGAQFTGGSGLDTLANIENVIGSDHSDQLAGDWNDNVLTGGEGDDDLYGGTGSDTLIGGDGEDRYTVDDAGDVVLETNGSTDDEQWDVVLSHLGDYTLADNVEEGEIMRADAANLSGNARDNDLYAGLGDNVLDGAGGNDTLIYLYSGSGGVSVSLAVVTAQATGGSGSDTVLNIENLVGTDFDDKLTGSSGANLLAGEDGNDSLYGGLGNDTMFGGEGADVYSVQDAGDLVVEHASCGCESDFVYSYLSNYTLVENVEQGRVMNTTVGNMTGNALDNILFASTGANALAGAGGSDTVSYAFGASGGVTVSLALTTAQATGGSGSDILSGIENLAGSAYADHLSGNADANVLSGGAGTDQLYGNAGNDELDGGVDDDIMHGGDGADLYHVSDHGDLAVETNTSLDAAETDLVLSYMSAYTLGANIEQARVMSASGANLLGNDGDNVLYAGVGDNVLAGGAGNDTVSYVYATGGVIVDLSTAGYQDTGGSALDAFDSIENLTGTDHDDIFVGDDQDNVLSGGAGGDQLQGLAGNDTLIGGDGMDYYMVDDAGDVVIETNASLDAGQRDTVASGLANYTLSANVEDGVALGADPVNLTGNELDNTLYAGLGDNVLDGGDGNDTVSYAGTPGAVAVSLAQLASQATGNSGSDTLAGIENLTGGDHGDALTGDDGSNRLNGAEGTDTLDGGAGDDTLIGGNGADVFHVDSAGDVVVEDNTSADPSEADTVLSTVASYTLGDNIEHGGIATALAADMTGNALDNTIHAGAGDNVLDGGDGIDMLSYMYGGPVVVSLNELGGQATGGSGSDTLAGFENLTGSLSADELAGNHDANLIYGLWGDDTLSGHGGDDTLDGGLGADTMFGGDGADTYYVNESGDVVVETVTSTDPAETDIVLSFASDYTLGDYVEQGRVMLAAGGNLTGNAQDNILYAGVGDNELSGGDGSDTVDYASHASGVMVSLATIGPVNTGGSGADTLTGIENLAGTSHADSLTGDANANVLDGNGDADLLDGGAGVDTMRGGDGADVYFVDDDSDVIVETNDSTDAGERDTVMTTTDYILSDNVEDGMLIDGAAINLAGNAGDNVLTAGTGDNILSGEDGIDTVSYANAGSGVMVNLASAGTQATGGSGADQLSGFENLTGSQYADFLFGDGGANLITGGGGSDQLDGGTGDDTMAGNDGADIYYVRDADDIVIESNASTDAAERDLVVSYLSDYTLGENIERGMIGNLDAANLGGNELDNELLAATGDNYLDGGDGQDTASYANGGAVTVSLALGDWQDTGGSGWDYLVSIENLTGSSSGDTLTGDAGGNVLDGSGGNDTLNGGGGNDTLDGGAGDNTMAGGDGADVYAVRSSGDVVTEINTSTDIGESDLVMSYLTSHTLGANIERGMVSTTGSSVLVGNELDNILYSGTGHTALMGGIGEDTASYANGAAVTVSLALDNYQATGGSGSDALYEIENLDGSAYADMLTGDAGSNVLSGGDGADTLDGGAGDDVLTGGAGDDIFSFGSIADTSFEDVLDRISDFATGDKIDLSLIDADSDTGGNDAFTSFVGEGDAFTAAGQLRLVDGVLYGNTDGDEDAEFAITLTGVTTIEIGDIIG